MSVEIGRRLLGLLPVLTTVAIIIFLLGHLIPGDPAAMIAGENATPDQVETIRHALGLDRPLPAQFASWVRGVLRGDLGDSMFMKQPVGLSIRQRVEPTGLLALFSLILAILIGLPAGIIAAVHRNSVADRLAMALSMLGVSTPSFWLGILMILLFAVQWRLLPAAGYVPLREDPVACLRYLCMPAVSLGVVHAALLSRMVRSSVLDILHKDYVRTARAKGLKESLVLIRHVIPNVLVPTLTVIGNSAGALLGGAVTAEVVFCIPGLGRMMVQAIANRDYPVLQGGVLVIAMVYVLVNAVTDIACAAADPRIRERSR